MSVSGEDIAALSLDELLARLQARAALPWSRSSTAPPALYWRQDVLELEQERIFKKGWVCPGLVADIPRPGDYLTYSIGDQPVVVVRDRDGIIRAFSNVCRHRMMLLLEGRGNVGSIVCPYHGWTYGLDGRLVGAGQMQRTECFEKATYVLPEIRVETWKGWIYLTIDAAAPAVADLLAPLGELVDRYGMEEYVPVLHQDLTWATNWKLLVENFMEGYHGPVAHRATVGAGVSLNDTVFPDTVSDEFTYCTFTKPEGARYGTAHPDNTRLQGIWRRTAVLPTVFPAHMYSLSPDYLWYLSLRPDGVGTVKVRIGIALAPEVVRAQADLPAFLEPLSTFFDQVNEEDRRLVEGIYRGARAPLAQSGPFSWLEREIHDFARYLARQLAAGRDRSSDTGGQAVPQ
jgi:phenylpropionate dioxygenase-like ring-hydroxylating dioxygenase large terminal subunit